MYDLTHRNLNIRELSYMGVLKAWVIREL
uniref:Uncharacterized protein n=1 Tax=Rhizophora mucronata TaxID=61149 RepID=A0A2P2PUQ8_RHIMU